MAPKGSSTTVTAEVKRIAKIKDTFLGWEDHGIFTATLTLDYGGSVQGCGMYGLSYNPKGTGHIGAPGGIDHLMAILRACGTDSWEKLKGRTVFAILDMDGFGGKVIGLEPLPTEGGKKFYFKDIILWPEGLGKKEAVAS